MLRDEGRAVVDGADGAAAGWLTVGRNDGIEEPELPFADGALMAAERVDARGRGCHVCFWAAVLRREPASATGWKEPSSRRAATSAANAIFRHLSRINVSLLQLQISASAGIFTRGQPVVRRQADGFDSCVCASFTTSLPFTSLILNDTVARSGAISDEVVVRSLAA